MRTRDGRHRLRHLASSDALLDALVEVFDDAVLIHDAAGNVSAWTHTAERLFGHDADAVVGQAVVGLFAETKRSAIQSVVDAVVAGDRVTRFETEAVRADGMRTAVVLSSCPVVDADGSTVAGLMVVRDVTEQLFAQAALTEVEARARESEALAHVGSWLWDVGTATVQWSDECHRIHAVDPLNFGGTLTAHLELVHPDDRDAVQAAMSTAAETGRTFDHEYTIVLPSGEGRVVHARARPTFGSTQSVAVLRGIVREVVDEPG